MGCVFESKYNLQLVIVAPIFFWGCLRDNKEDNEKKRKQDEKRLEIQCMINFYKMLMFAFRLNFVPNLMK